MCKRNRKSCKTVVKKGRKTRETPSKNSQHMSCVCSHSASPLVCMLIMFVQVGGLLHISAQGCLFFLSLSLFFQMVWWQDDVKTSKSLHLSGWNRNIQISFSWPNYCMILYFKQPQLHVRVQIMKIIIPSPHRKPAGPPTPVWAPQCIQSTVLLLCTEAGTCH